MLTTLLERLREATASRRPLILVRTAEEERLRGALGLLAAERGQPLTVVTCLEEDDPLARLEAIASGADAAVWVFLDLGERLEEPEVRRRLRACYLALRDAEGGVIVIPTRAALPPAGLAGEVAWVEAPPPSPDELLAVIDEVQALAPARPIPGEQAEVAARLSGLELNDARHVLQGALASAADEAGFLAALTAGQATGITRRVGVLERVSTDVTLDDLGGLDQLKAWLSKRRGLLSTEALAAGQPIPRGILLMGVSGCGKSFAAKTTSALWGVPLFRLDMNLVFSGLVGRPEAAFHSALRAIEALAPAVLWVDEVENGLGAVSGDTGSQTHLFSAFLTWMQEKPPLVFVAATANRIAALPAEVLRKGRFDQVFFCDLPSEAERREIIAIHLRRAGVEPKTFNLDYLVMDTQTWTGAEIEQAIGEARVDARAQGRRFTTDDVSRVADKHVPLARSMHEQIRALREWVQGRATRASSGDPALKTP